MSAFGLPSNVWDGVPHYADWGFAVFKLKLGGWLKRLLGRKTTIHPMAFEFPTRDQRLFFPTLHVHDGEVHDQARFDHTFYAQPEARMDTEGWLRSELETADFVAVEETCGLVSEAPCYRQVKAGMLPNEDSWLA